MTIPRPALSTRSGRWRTCSNCSSYRTVRSRCWSRVRHARRSRATQIVPNTMRPPPSVINEFENYVKLNKKVSPEVVGVVQQIEDYAKLADTVASHLAVKIPDKQGILETPSVTERLEKVLGLMESEISVLQVEKRIRTRVKRQMEKTQREYYLNEQMKAIQKELGDEEG